VLVVELLVFAQRVEKMGLVPDEGPERSSARAGSHPAFHDGVHAWHSDPGLDDFDASACGTASKVAG
jgi:hypothetical protein